MTTVYRALAYFGLDFWTEQDALSFLNDNAVTDYLDSIEGEYLGLICLNSFSGNDWALGYEIELGVSLDVYQKKWDEAFPNAPERPRGYLVVNQF